jgi:hypothetical protein
MRTTLRRMASAMADYIDAWQCIGCGRIEAPQTCIGVCRDRKVLLVTLDEHQQALDEVQRVYGQLEQLEGLLARIARTTPREGQFESSWRAYQEQAQALLARLEAGNAAAAEPAAPAAAASAPDTGAPEIRRRDAPG